MAGQGRPILPRAASLPNAFHFRDMNVIRMARAEICTRWDRFPDGTEFVGIGVQADVRVDR